MQPVEDESIRNVQITSILVSCCCLIVYSVLTLTCQYTDSSIYIGRAQLAEKGSADFMNFSQSSLFGGSKVLAELHRVEK